MSGREGLDTYDEAEGASFAEVKTPNPPPCGHPLLRGKATEAANGSSFGLCGWRDEHDVEPPKRCEQAKGTAARRGVNGAEATMRHESWP